jgi:hypothetical protein
MSMDEPTPTFDCPRRIERYMLVSFTLTNEQLSELIDRSLDPERHPVHDDDGQLIAPKDHWRSDGTCSYCGSLSPETLFEALACGAELGPTDKNYKLYVRGGDRIARGGERQTFDGKFYTLHLNRENAARLRALIDGDKVAIGVPGYFYAGLWLALPAEG